MDGPCRALPLLYIPAALPPSRCFLSFLYYSKQNGATLANSRVAGGGRIRSEVSIQQPTTITAIVTRWRFSGHCSHRMDRSDDLTVDHA